MGLFCCLVFSLVKTHQCELRVEDVATMAIDPLVGAVVDLCPDRRYGVLCGGRYACYLALKQAKADYIAAGYRLDPDLIFGESIPDEENFAPSDLIQNAFNNTGIEAQLPDVRLPNQHRHQHGDPVFHGYHRHYQYPWGVTFRRLVRFFFWGPPIPLLNRRPKLSRWA